MAITASRSVAYRTLDWVVLVAKFLRKKSRRGRLGGLVTPTPLALSPGMMWFVCVCVFMSPEFRFRLPGGVLASAGQTFVWYACGLMKGVVCFLFFFVSSMMRTHIGSMQVLLLLRVALPPPSPLSPPPSYVKLLLKREREEKG